MLFAPSLSQRALDQNMNPHRSGKVLNNPCLAMQSADRSLAAAAFWRCHENAQCAVDEDLPIGTLRQEPVAVR
jgi:hypothetical protein